jgi:hypothetical protein
MEVLEQKKELVDWISGLDNPAVLDAVYSIKENSTLSFKERFAKGLTVDEFKTEMKKRIQNYPNKK